MKKKFLAAIVAMTMAMACMTACSESSSEAKTSSKSENSSSAASSSQAESSSAADSSKEAEPQSSAVEEQSSNVNENKDQEALKTANSNAKLVFTTLNNTASDLIADGESVEALKYKGTVDGLSGTLGEAVKKALGENGAGNGYVYIDYDPSKDEGQFAQWSEAETGAVVGQYPDPPKSVEEAKSVYPGERIGVPKSSDDSSESYVWGDNGAVKGDSEELKTANTNAKHIFIIVNNTAADMIADGMSVDTLDYKGTVAGLSGPLGDAVKAAAKGNIDNHSYVAIHFDPSDDTDSNFVHWSASESGAVVGQYPNSAATTEDAKKITLGKKV